MARVAQSLPNACHFYDLAVMCSMHIKKGDE